MPRDHRGDLTAAFTGGATADETADEETDETATGSFEDLVPPADPEFFSRTYLALADDWTLAEPVPSPAPFPLQVLPRVAFTINYNFVYNTSTGKWEPQEPFSGGGGALDNAFRAQVDGFGDLTVPTGSPNTQTVPIRTDYGGAFDPDDLINETDDTWVCPADGQYFFTFMMAWSNVTEGNDYQFFLEQVGEQNHALQERQAEVPSPAFPGSVIIDLTAGDEVRIRAAHDSPNTETIEDSQDQTHFAGFRVA